MSRLFPRRMPLSLHPRSRLAGSSLRDANRTRFLPALEGMEQRALLSTVYVDNDFSGATSGALGSKTNPYTTIQAGVEGAGNGGTVIVEADVYHESVNVDKSVTLLGAQAGVDAQNGHVPANKESVVDNTTTPFNVTASDVTIDGFTVQGETSSNQLGFGIVLGAGTHGSHIQDNIIQDNIVGLALANNSNSDQTVIQGNLFQNNNNPGPASGTGIYTDQFVSGGTLTNVLIAGNTFAGNQGGAIMLGSSAAATSQTNIIISGNMSSGDKNLVTAFDTQNSQIVDNTVRGDGGGIAIGGGNTGLIIIGNNLDGQNPKTGSADGIQVDSSLMSQYGYGGVNTNLNISNNTIKNFEGSGLHVAASSLTNSVIASNQITHNENDGIWIETGNTGNVIFQNQLHGNQNYDAEDDSTGSGTDGTANTWDDNKLHTSDPSGLSSKPGPGH